MSELGFALATAVEEVIGLSDDDMRINNRDHDERLRLQMLDKLHLRTDKAWRSLPGRLPNDMFRANAD